MRALFKPDDPKKLIIRDADMNEVSLINYFMGIINNGGKLTAETRFDLNDKPAGLLFTVTESECPPIGPDIPTYNVYIPVEFVELYEDIYCRAKFNINEGYEIVNMDAATFDMIKRALTPDCIDLSLSIIDGQTFEIVWKFYDEKEPFTFQVPEGLLNLREIASGKENYYTGTFTLVYDNEIIVPGESL